MLFSSFVKVRFYSIQINILVDLSILYQNLSVESVLNMSTVVTKAKYRSFKLIFLIAVSDLL